MVARFRLDEEKRRQGAPAGTSTYVNVRKLTAVLRQKICNSEEADSSMSFFFMMIVFIMVVLAQRNSAHSEQCSSSLRRYIRDVHFRDPVTLELKTLMQLQTVDDFWNWHQLVLFEKLLIEEHYGGVPVAPNATGTVLLHNRLTAGIRMVQRRARNGTCTPIPHLQAFATDCFGQTYWEGSYGPVSTEPFQVIVRVVPAACIWIARD